MKTALMRIALPPIIALAQIEVMFADVRRGNGTPPPPKAPHEQDAIEELRAKMVEVHERGETIRATADAENRLLNEEESKELEQLAEQFETLDAEVAKRERLQAQRDRLGVAQPRVSQPAPLEGNGSDGASPPQRQRITGGELVGASKNTAGFRSVGEFATAVLVAKRGHVDPRLVAAATTYGNEGAGADGGFALPPDFRDQIVKKMQGEESLLARTDQQFTSSDRMTVPLDSTTPWQTAGGIQVEFEGEGEVSTGTKPKLDQLEVKAHKAKALVPMTDELLADVPGLSRYLPSKVAEKFTSKINAMIVGGNGVGRPQGLLSSGSKITVTKESGQTAATIVFANIVKMWARMYAPLRSGAIWLVNQDIEPQLLSMTVPGSQPAFPAYLPPGGLSGAPYGSLLGRPVVPVEACETLGTEGDIILTNLQSYLTVQKVGGIRQDVSIHLYFDQDITAFRFVMRIGGQSWWKEPASRLKGSNTLSNIITLATRS